MPDLIPTASEAEWLEERRKRITASEIATVMGLSSYSSPYKLYHQKLGNLPSDDDSEAMELGRLFEPYVSEKFARLHPEFAVLGDGRSLYAHPEHDWLAATPDRIVHELHEVDACTCGGGLWPYGHEPGCGLELDAPVAVLECKVDGGSDEWGEEGSDEIPVAYRCQALIQMDVMGVAVAYVAAYIWHRRKLRVYELHMNDAARADLKLMLGEARDFLDRIDLKDEPDVDWRPATIDALKTLHPLEGDEGIFVSTQLGQRYRAACRNYKHWEQRKRLYEAQLRKRMGSHRRALLRSEDIPGGDVIARRDVYDVRESVRKPYTVDKLVPVPPKKEAKTS